MKLSLGSILVCSTALLFSASVTNAKAVNYQKSDLEKRTYSSTTTSSSSLNSYALSVVSKNYDEKFQHVPEFDKFADQALQKHLVDPSRPTQTCLDCNSPDFVSSLEFYTCNIKKCGEVKSQIAKCIGKLENHLPDEICEYKFVAVAFTEDAGIVMAAKCDKNCPSGKII
ncbi:hypothetical protein H4219_005754 [Mycoemilia scoparia]|uniref:Uncharacterized protein n=1 Tax=Mycoemilia scoparia TaxID=417184 RepID=A0A9W7ZN42_9FUNG|nr:hypothetical protein H4219_005754 [Mycoemilia scoparia]